MSGGKFGNDKFDVSPKFSQSADDEKVEALMKKIDQNEDKIIDLNDEIWQLTIEICAIKGHCPRCKNTHYPHC